MFVSNARLSPVLLASAIAVLLLPLRTGALTVDELLEQVRGKRTAVKSYIADVHEKGSIGDHEFSNRFAITWVKDGRFRILSTFSVSSERGPLELAAWFDGGRAYVAAESRGFKRYAKIDFSELPAATPFPSTEFIGGIFNPGVLYRFEPKALTDYQMTVEDGEKVLGKETHLLRASLKVGIKPKTIMLKGKVVPTQAEEVSIWYGKDDGMMYRLSLNAGGRPIYMRELLSLKLNPPVIGVDLAPDIPEGAEVFDATREFRSSMRELQDKAAE